MRITALTMPPADCEVEQVSGCHEHFAVTDRSFVRYGYAGAAPCGLIQETIRRSQQSLERERQYAIVETANGKKSDPHRKGWLINENQ